MKILVAGGAGYIGSVLTRRLLEQGEKVRVFDSFFFGGDGLLSLYGHKNLEIQPGDVRSRKELKKALKNIDAVVNLAALVGEHVCQPQPQAAREINFQAAVNLAKLAKGQGIKRFFFASTCSNYGISRSGHLADETADLHPLSLYAETKVAAEKALLELVDATFNPVILRLGTVYGLSPRMRFDLLLNELVRDAFVDGALTVFQPESWRPLVAVDDVAAAFLTCFKKAAKINPPAIFNIGYKNYQKKELAESIKKILPKTKIKLSPVTKDKRDYRVSFEKMRRVLGFEPQHEAFQAAREIAGALNAGLFFNPRDYRYHNIGWPKKNEN